MLSQERCCKYWPTDRSEKYQYYVVDPISEQEYSTFVMRDFKVKDAKVSLESSDLQIKHNMYQLFVPPSVLLLSCHTQERQCRRLLSITGLGFDVDNGNDSVPRRSEIATSMEMMTTALMLISYYAFLSNNLRNFAVRNNTSQAACLQSGWRSRIAIQCSYIQAPALNTNDVCSGLNSNSKDNGQQNGHFSYTNRG